MRIAVGCDHGGFPLKETVMAAIREAGHEALDFGTDSPERVDFPDYAEPVARAVASGEADRGILMCGSGVGMAIAANKVPGAYASVCHDTYSAHQGVEHDGMNVLCMGGRIIGPALAREIVLAFLAAKPDLGERYARRREKVRVLEGQSNP
ncbi:MAG TPA: ribose 5-phosphate isomerase B [Anaerolineae bacterium]|nr:ribose 5-phosphate isomerase B [Anaerolineae bacterium]HID84067.1 ribose 5-phosphate isomerase B [Anaerolineales bacterium]HIQ09229.1 ribose 5-phosphate isomerase B [Anaerolineaceae bacterium]